MNFIQRLNKSGDKITFYYDYGRGPGQRPSTGIFIYAKPNNQIQKNHNKEALKLLETKKSQVIIEQQAIGSSYIPSHKFKENFIDYFDEYIKLNKRDGNRHLTCCFSKFKEFIDNKSFIAPIEISENFCKRFRRYLLDKLTGETPANYFARFKWVIDAATSDGYFVKNPTANISAVSNPSVALKEHLEVDEYLALLNTPWTNEEVSQAFIFSCYTGLRWVDVKLLNWNDIKGNTLVTRIIQKKTGRPVTLTLHSIAKSILQKRQGQLPADFNGKKLVFDLPANGANKVLGEWVKRAGIEKSITWSCARLSYSILLQDTNVDSATVAYLLGHTTTKQVERTYKRHRPKDQSEAINKLPTPKELPFFLKSSFTESGK